MASVIILPGVGGVGIGAPDNNYHLADGFGVGASTFTRQYAKSPYIAYQQLLSALQASSTLIVPVIVTGTDGDNVQDKIDILVTAFTRFEYVLEYGHYMSGTPDNATYYSWNCECADYAPGDGGVLKNGQWNQFTQVITFSVPRNGPILGPIR